MVYVTYSSTELLPTDVVFCQPLVAIFNGIRRTWTTHVYILSAEFADVIPANEDPMHMNGNAHLMPHIVHDNNLFVMPEYPAMSLE
jgi:hypothetical protein